MDNKEIEPIKMPIEETSKSIEQSSGITPSMQVAPLTIERDKCIICKTADAKHTCNMCGGKICSNDISNVDITKCKTCSTDAGVKIETKIHEQIEFENEEGEEKYTVIHHRGRTITLDGSRWMDFAIRISELDDAKVEEVVEFHKIMIAQLEQEKLNRKIKRARQEVVDYKLGKTTLIKKKTKTISSSKELTIDKIIEMIDKASEIDKKKLKEALLMKLAEINLGIGK